jgi:hypothetical protein
MFEKNEVTLLTCDTLWNKKKSIVLIFISISYFYLLLKHMHLFSTHAPPLVRMRPTICARLFSQIIPISLPLPYLPTWILPCLYAPKFPFINHSKFFTTPLASTCTRPLACMRLPSTQVRPPTRACPSHLYAYPPSSVRTFLGYICASLWLLSASFLLVHTIHCHLYRSSNSSRFILVPPVLL